ncbi:MAG: DUF4160 domain-containing protein [Spirochaeta sp.]|nr:DUF4160 domain-containing protein [Spirochaeta sp.]
MPTILFLKGWRFFFYTNEGNEPPHIHVAKADAEGKFWLDSECYDVPAAFAHNISPADLRFIRRTLLDHFDEFLESWKDVQGE